MIDSLAIDVQKLQKQYSHNGDFSHYAQEIPKECQSNVKLGDMSQQQQRADKLRNSISCSNYATCAKQSASSSFNPHSLSNINQLSDRYKMNVQENHLILPFENYHLSKYSKNQRVKTNFINKKFFYCRLRSWY